MNPLIKSQQVEFTNNCSETIYNRTSFEVTPNDTTLEHAKHDDDLQHIIRAWSTLPPILKARIVGMVDAVTILLRKM